ncbi:MAG: hypothetical protein R3F21_04605 [Myxococcota bacterium]
MPAIFVHRLEILVAALCSLFMAGAALAEYADEAPRRRFYASVGTGLEFVRGDYGDVDADGDKLYTNSASVPVFARIEWEPITFRIRVPFLLVDGSDQIFGGNEGTEPGADGTSGRRTDYGLGDVTTSLTWTYYPPPTLPAVPTVDLGVRVKIPTAMNGLGTDTTDVTPQLELSKAIGRFSAFTGAGYRFRTGDEFDDTWQAFVGASVRIFERVSLGVGYDFRQSSTSFSDDAHEISTYLTIRSGTHWRITPEAIFGLSDGSPDYGGALTLSYQF